MPNFLSGSLDNASTCEAFLSAYDGLVDAHVNAYDSAMTSAAYLAHERKLGEAEGMVAHAAQRIASDSDGVAGVIQKASILMQGLRDIPDPYKTTYSDITTPHDLEEAYELTVAETLQGVEGIAEAEGQDLARRVLRAAADVVLLRRVIRPAVASATDIATRKAQIDQLGSRSSGRAALHRLLDGKLMAYAQGQQATPHPNRIEIPIVYVSRLASTEAASMAMLGVLSQGPRRR